jgi:hypothetical protein
MAKKTEASELRDLMFQQMNRLNDPNVNLEKELQRAEAMAKVGTVIVNSHKQEVDMMKVMAFGNRKGKQASSSKQLTDGSGK